MTDISLYLHIPFCRKACSYCDFYFVVSPQSQDNFFKALHNEIALYHRFVFPQAEVCSIYFGGGTPSWVHPHHIGDTLTLIRDLTGGDKEVEVTLEANPDDLSPERLKACLQAGVNRISLGIQSFNPNALQYLKRDHDPDQAEFALDQVSRSYLKGQLRSWSVDLIYGLPISREWGKELVHILDKVPISDDSSGKNREGPPHLSLYALTVEPQTSLAYEIKQNRKPAPLSEIAQKEYLLSTEILRGKGYDHYEVSNYALPGHHSQHNARYWQHRDYWGGGPGAHSYLDGKHYHNRPQLSSYIRNFLEVDRGRVDEKEFLRLVKNVNEEEVLNPEQKCNQYLMVGLRTARGVLWEELESQFPSNFNRKSLLDKIQVFRDQGWLVEDERIRLTEEGWLVSDAILRELFL